MKKICRGRCIRKLSQCMQKLGLIDTNYRMLDLLIMKIGSETYLSQVITIVKEAQESKSRAQDLANRAAK